MVLNLTVLSTGGGGEETGGEGRRGEERGGEGRRGEEREGREGRRGRELEGGREGGGRWTGGMEGGRLRDVGWGRDGESTRRAIILYSLTELKRFTTNGLTPITTRGSVDQSTAVLEIITAS